MKKLKMLKISLDIISHKVWHKYFKQKFFDQTLGMGLKKWLLHSATCQANERKR